MLDNLLSHELFRKEDEIGFFSVRKDSSDRVLQAWRLVQPFSIVGHCLFEFKAKKGKVIVLLHILHQFPMLLHHK